MNSVPIRAHCCIHRLGLAPVFIAQTLAGAGLTALLAACPVLTDASRVVLAPLDRLNLTSLCHAVADPGLSLSVFKHFSHGPRLSLAQSCFFFFFFLPCLDSRNLARPLLPQTTPISFSVARSTPFISLGQVLASPH